VVLAFLVGVPVGTFTVYVIRAATMGTVGLAIPIPMAFPPILFLLLGLTAMSLAAASFLSAAKVSRLDLSYVLRMR
jgi:ABC-type antimicrobial peptide transport system permease subunit